MSFSTYIKDELVSLELLDKKSLLKGMLQVNGSINLSSSGLHLEYKTKNENVKNLLVSLIKDVYKVDTEVQELREVRLNKDLYYKILINQGASLILRDLNIMQSKEDSQYSLKKDLPEEINRIEYLKGAFLSGGSVNDPQTFTYHLEIQTFNTIVASNLRDLMNTFYLGAKISKNRRGFIVYLKSAERVSDFIRTIGASEALLYFENLRIERDLSNSINRVINCEVANQKKVQETASRQIKEIDEVLKYYGESLKKTLVEAINLRKAYPDDSLQELSNKSEEHLKHFISRSALSHRLREIHELYLSIPEK